MIATRPTRAALWLGATCLLVASTAYGGAPAPAPAPAPEALFKLKPGARGKLCLKCHPALADAASKPVVHAPVKTGECTSCHDPHASDHGKLLARDAKSLCTRCHQVVPPGAKSVHKPVQDGECARCHQPHASENKFLLAKAGNEQCASCHKELVEAAAKAKVKHRPVEQGCSSCHQVHGSATAGHLLKSDVPGLCLGCHKAERPLFVKQHQGYLVGKSNCTMCHDPHGTDQAGMLQANVHSPVAAGLCARCHEDPGSPNSLKPRKAGPELCKDCHAKRVAEMLSRNRLHRPVVDARGCSNCHAAHASRQKGLLVDSQLSTCGACHPDTLKRQERSPTPHDPVKAGQCTTCHEPHSSNNVLMMKKPNDIEVCGACHRWEKHSSHPLGDKYKDPRNANLTVRCLSCHRAHGTEYKHLIPYPTTTDLCTKCHEQFKR